MKLRGNCVWPGSCDAENHCGCCTEIGDSMCMCNNCNSDCTGRCQTVKLEVGKKYKSRNGVIWRVVAYSESEKRFIVTNDKQSQHSLAWRYTNGRYNECLVIDAPNDLVSEFKEPRTFKVYVYEFYDGSIGVFRNNSSSFSTSKSHNPPKLLAIKTITEGEGKDSYGHWIGEVGGET